MPRANPAPATWVWLGGAALVGIMVYASTRKKKLTFRQALLAVAQEDLSAGVKEDTENAGAALAKYFLGSGVAPPANWCALATRYWIRQAALRAGVPQPIEGSAGAKATMAQLQAAGLWVAKGADPSAILPGSIVVWHRGAPGAWTGHIGVVEAVAPDGVTFTTVEGNSGPKGDRVARNTRKFSDENLLGFGVFK